MDVAGMGAKLTDRFVDLGWVKDAADLYSLPWQEVAQLEGLGEKSATNLRAGVEASKNRPLGRLINALGIRHIGERTAARDSTQAEDQHARASRRQGAHELGDRPLAEESIDQHAI